MCAQKLRVPAAIVHPARAVLCLARLWLSRILSDHAHARTHHTKSRLAWVRACSTPAELRCSQMDGRAEAAVSQWITQQLWTRGQHSTARGFAPPFIGHPQAMDKP